MHVCMYENIYNAPLLQPKQSRVVTSSGRQLNFTALNRGRHLCSAGRPSGWALAHILVFSVILCATNNLHLALCATHPGATVCVSATFVRGKIFNVPAQSRASHYGAVVVNVASSVILCRLKQSRSRHFRSRYIFPSVSFRPLVYSGVLLVAGWFVKIASVKRRAPARVTINHQVAPR